MKDITASLLALMIAAPVAAQSIIPRERPATAERDGTYTGDLARRSMDQFAACVLDRKRLMTLKALDLPSDSPEQNKLFGKLVKTECIASAELHFDGPAFRGSLYKALVRKEFGRKDVFPVPTPVAAEQVDEDEASYSDEAGVLKFASCVIHKDPQNARAAILSTAGSPPESDAMAALEKVYGQCLYEDATLRFSKGRLIGFLAQAYYRDAIAATEMSAPK
ncbi:MAG TPA: hypothetical protein VFP37_01600 [Steroidobacteraceae bacterium]|nr:hypothetical protein [Steroidobacteraceae bacterium]